MGLNEIDAETEALIARVRRRKAEMRAGIEAAATSSTPMPDGATAYLLPADAYRAFVDGIPPGARFCRGGFEQMEHLTLPALGMVIVEAWPSDRDRWG
jgi:hypothetical protein